MIPLYTVYKDPTKVGDLNETLEAIIKSADTTQSRVPPGIYAEYGYLQMQQGKSKEAIDLFKQERALWPESKVFMDRMIQVASISPRTRPKGLGSYGTIANRRDSRCRLDPPRRLCKRPEEIGLYPVPERGSPVHLLVPVPPINKSVDVNAPDYFMATIAEPLAERGYYVFPVNMVKQVLSDDGLSDANLVHRADPRRLGELFGADAVMYISIVRWDAKYAIISTTVTVELTYVIKSTHTGAELWKNHQILTYSPQGASTGGLAALWPMRSLRRSPKERLITCRWRAKRMQRPSPPKARAYQPGLRWAIREGCC